MAGDGFPSCRVAKLRAVADGSKNFLLLVRARCLIRADGFRLTRALDDLWHPERCRLFSTRRSTRYLAHRA